MTIYNVSFVLNISLVINNIMTIYGVNFAFVATKAKNYI